MDPYLRWIARRLSGDSRNLREAAAVIAGFAALTLLMTYPLVQHVSDALPNDLGDPLLNAWILAWDADRLLHGLRGLWQAPIFFPYANTLAYSEHLLGIAVVSAPVEWVFGNPVLTYNVAFLFSYVLAGCGMYLLVNALTGNRWGALIAGVAFAFCPYRVARISHLQVLMSGWMPIGLWALHRYFAEGRRAALAGFGAAFVLQALSNGYYLFFFSVPVGIITADALIRTPRSRGRMLAELALIFLLIGAVIAPVASVYYEVRREQGLVRRLPDIQAFSADLTSYLHVDAALRLWGGVLRTGKPERELFAGATVLALAAVALTTIWRRRDVSRRLSLRAATFLYAIIALFALILSLGPEPRAWGVPLLPTGPYQWLLTVVPGFDGLRVASRFAMIVFLAVSVLAGIGVARFFPRLARPVTATLGMLLVGAILAESYHGPMVCVPLARRFSAADNSAYGSLVERPPGAVLELPVDGREPTHSLLFQYRTLQHRHPIVNGFSGYRSPLLEFLREGPTPLIYVEQMRDLIRALRLMGVRYIVFHEPLYKDPNRAQATISAIREQSGQLEDIRTFGSTTLVQLQLMMSPPTAPGDLQEIPRDEFRAGASHEPGRLPLAFDGDLGTRWLSGQRQSGDEWVAVQFRRRRSVARLRLAVTDRSLGDYPRRLRIESSSDGEHFETLLYEDALFPQLALGLTRQQNPVMIDINLPPNDTLVLRLRQVGETTVWYWSIDELTLWERSDRG